MDKLVINKVKLYDLNEKNLFHIWFECLTKTLQYFILQILLNDN